MPTGNRISAYQYEKDEERMETKEYRRRHLEQFIRDRKRKYYRDKYSRELVTTIHDVMKPVRMVAG